MDLDIYLYRMLGAVPLLLVLLAGVVLCVVHAERRLLFCALTAAGLGIALLNQLVLPFVTDWLFRVAFVNVHEIRWRVLAGSLIYSVAEALAWGLVLYAMFGISSGRSRPPDPTDNGVYRREQ